MVFNIFLSAGARAQVGLFLPNFDVIKTTEAQMEPVYIPCFGRGEIQSFFRILQFLRVLQFGCFLRVLRSFSSLSFYG